MAVDLKCVAFVLLQVSWVFAQAQGDFDGFREFADKNNPDGFSFSLVQGDLDGAGPSNESTSNDTTLDVSTSPPMVVNPQAFAGLEAQDDQPQPAPVAPTRLPINPGAASTPPPLVRPEGNSTGNATTAHPAPTDAPKHKGGKDGGAGSCGNLALVLGGACVLHLLY